MDFDREGSAKVQILSEMDQQKYGFEREGSTKV
jgi:hypothetical protein